MVSIPLSRDSLCNSDKTCRQFMTIEVSIPLSRDSLCNNGLLWKLEYDLSRFQSLYRGTAFATETDLLRYIGAI